ncbi:SdrD B-like domain-containing protein [Buchananella felis]|uniref:SdrD B-like domain-containing protein n=1 Tax=Buchananella felis TaxID=3231492 RepID=UPI0035270CA4
MTLFNGDAEAGEPGQNEAVTITNITVKKLTGGVETDDVAHKWSRVNVKWDWDARNANPQVGQHFTLGFPFEPVSYKFVDTKEFELKLDQGSKPTIAVCYPNRGPGEAKPFIKCVFTDGLTTAVQEQGLSNLRGNAWIESVAHESNGKTELEFNANGTKIMVPTPGGEPITAPIGNYWIQPPDKSNWGVTSETARIVWHVQFSGKVLREMMNKSQIPDEIVIHDSLSQGQVYEGSYGFVATAVDLPTEGDIEDLCIFDHAGICSVETFPYPKRPGHSLGNLGEVTVQAEFSNGNRAAKFTIRRTGAPLRDDVNYRLTYRTKPTTPNEKIDINTTYSNEARIEGVNKKLYSSARYRVTAGGTAQMDPGYGTFAISKIAKGEAKTALPDGERVRFLVDWQLPANKPNASDHPGWVEPNRPLYVEVPLDRVVTYLPETNTRMPFPAGTTITLTEDTNWTSSGLPGGIKFETPSVTIDGGQASSTPVATFVIVSNKVIEAEYTNTFSFKAVSVGDYVWFDKNKDGLQDDSDEPLNGVTLTISRTDGKPVKDVNGAPVTTTTTNSQGKYLFDNLEILPAGQKYKVTVTPPSGYLPTKPEQGTDRSKDSSTGSATARELPNGGDSDLTLDFGFVKTVPGIDIEKYDGNWAGVKFNGDTPEMNNGQPATLPAGDRDSADTALVLSGLEAQPVKFTVTNTGTDGLKNIVVTDRTSAGPALTNLKCRINNQDVAAVGGVVTAPADWVLPVKGSFECTGTLPKLSEADTSGAYHTTHANSATVEATPVAGGDKVSDSDEWHAKRGKVSVGDYVWFDKNKDGLQDNTDVPLGEVTLTLSRTDNQPAKKIDGSVVTTTKTAANGKYLFPDLEILPAGVNYKVTVTAPAGYKPTVEGPQNGSGANDSSTDNATAKDLPNDGNSDLTLDFGFVKTAPGIDIEKYDGVWAGVQFNGDKPVLSNGQPAVLPAGDRDGADQALVLSGLEAQPVKFTVTNTGEDALKNVVVTDRTNGGPALTDFKCRIDNKDVAGVNGVVTAPADWVFAAKASFECTGTLPKLAEADATGAYHTSHANTATVEAVPVAGGDKVTDSDEWHAKRGKVSVGDYVWFDANKDGLQDNSDVPLKDVTLTISRTDNKPAKKIDGSVVTTTTTDAAGKYLFADLEILPAGVKYKVAVTTPDNYEPTTAGAGSDRAKDSSTGSETAVELPTDGGKDLSLDFGFVKKPTGIDIEKYDGAWSGVTFDQDGNAELVNGQPKVLPAGDRDTEDAALVLSGLAAQPVKFTVTNTGKGELNNVKVTDQTLAGPALTDLKCHINGTDIAAVNGVVTAPADWIFAPQASFDCTATLPAITDAAKHANKATVEATPVAGGDKVSDNDDWHAKRGKVSVGDYVWFDANKDGLQDTSDVPLQDVTLALSRTDDKPAKKIDGSVVTTTKTDAAGKYLFADLEILPAGVKYKVTVAPPVNYEPTTAGVGTDRAKDSSTDSETAVELPNDGDKDLTLDFGFVKKPTGIDIEKYDGAWSGVVFDQAGNAELVDGQPKVLPAGDRDTEDAALVLSGLAAQPVKFTVTNTGKGELNNVKVSDTTIVGPALTDFKCRIDGADVVAVDGVVSAPAAWVFAPKASFECTATLAAMTDAAKHANTARVEATPVAGGDKLTDSDNWHAKRGKVSVGDYVWYDANKDGLQDASDVALEDVTLTLSRTDGKPAKKVDGSVVTTTTTDATGKYLFADLEILPAGAKYVVTVTNPRGFVPTTPGAGSDRAKDSSTGSETAVVLPNDGDKDLSLDFGFVKAKVSVGDYVWFDANKDGLQDDDEKGIKDVVLTISRTDGKPVKDADGNPVTTTTTDASGMYLFKDLEMLPAGEKYVVTVTDPAGYVPTKAEAGSDRAKDSSTGSATAQELTQDGAKDLTLDFGFFFPEVSVGDYVWYDVNKDGLQDGTDVPLKDVTLTISRSDGKPVNNADHTARTELTTTTDEHGKYAFTGLEVLTGEVKYIVTVTAPFGYVPTKAGMNNGAGSDDSSTQTSASVADLSTDGANDPTLDFGFIKAKVSVGDYVWFDKNKDGLQDTGEPGIKDVTLTLTGPDGKSVTDVNGNPVGPVKTDEHGKYLFENLPVLPQGESYTVTVSDPAGYLPTKAGTNNGQGANDSSTTTSVSLADLSTDSASDLTLDFGYYKPSVTVGDYVFEDLNDNGIQDNTDKPIAGVTLKITGPDGKDVTDVNGNPVGPVKTDENGKYLFDNLPVLKDNQSYTVTITPPAGYQPAKTGQGTRETDSSTDKATTIGLTKDGDKDLSLDFGFKKPTTKGGKGGKLAKTGTNALTLAPYALTLLAAGGTLLLLRRKKN